MEVKIRPRKATDRGGSHWQRSQRSREPVDCVRCVRLRREWEHEDEE